MASDHPLSCRTRGARPLPRAAACNRRAPGRRFRGGATSTKGGRGTHSISCWSILRWCPASGAGLGVKRRDARSAPPPNRRARNVNRSHRHLRYRADLRGCAFSFLHSAGGRPTATQPYHFSLHPQRSSDSPSAYGLGHTPYAHRPPRRGLWPPTATSAHRQQSHHRVHGGRTIHGQAFKP